MIQPQVGAPIDMVADPTWQLAFGILHFAIAGLVVAYAAKTPIKEKNWNELLFRMMVLLGATLSAYFFEAAIDRAGQLWYAEIGAWPMSDFWGVRVPLWVAPVYTWFLGGGALILIHAVRTGAPRNFYYKVFLGIVIADLLLEVPIILMGGLYAYWGDTQPFFHELYFPVPAWYLFVNRFFDFFPAMMVLLVMSSGKKWAVWTIPFVMIAGAYGSYALTTWPVIIALQNDGSIIMTHIGGALTIGLALLGTYICVISAPKLQHAMDWMNQDKTESKSEKISSSLAMTD